MKHSTAQCTHTRTRNNVPGASSDAPTKKKTNLVDAEVRVGRDDRPRREVHTLAHEVPSDSSFLPLEPLPQSLQRLARPLRLLRLPRSLVVEQRGHLMRILVTAEEGVCGETTDEHEKSNLRNYVHFVFCI